MIKIVIAEDHQLMAEGIVSLLDTSVECCGIARTLAEATTLLASQKPDVLLLDIALPDGDGIDAIAQLSVASPKTRVLILTMYAEAAVIQRAMNGGAYGYLLKSSSRGELMDAIQTVTEGRTYICKEAQAIASNQLGDSMELTPREREILRLIVAGKSMKEIAGELCLGFETIHTYTKYLRQKLGCNNTASLVRTAIEQHLE